MSRECLQQIDGGRLVRDFDQFPARTIFGEFGKEQWWVTELITRPDRLRTIGNCLGVVVDGIDKNAPDGIASINGFLNRWDKNPYQRMFPRTADLLVNLDEKSESDSDIRKLNELFNSISRARYGEQGKVVQDGLFLSREILLVATSNMNKSGNSKEDELLLGQIREIIPQGLSDFMQQVVGYMNGEKKFDFDKAERYFQSIELMEPQEKICLRYTLKGLSQVYSSVFVGVDTLPKIAELFDISDDLQQAKALEVGAGSGDFLTQLIPDKANGGEVTIADNAPGMLLGGLRRGNLIGKNIVVADAAQTVAPEESQDVVIANFVIDTTSRPKETLDALVSQLKAGGTLLLSTPLPIRQTVGGIKFTKEGQEIGVGLNPLIDMELMINELEKRGLSVNKIKVTTYIDSDGGTLNEVCAFMFVCRKL